MELTTARGMSYNETILHAMMHYPTIFPSEETVQEHLFLGYGTGYAWNKEGRLAYYLSRSVSRGRTRIQRTKESILGERRPGDPFDNVGRFERGEHCCFQPCGHGPTLWTHDIADGYSPIMFVLRGEITPAKDWQEAIDMFCYQVLEPDWRTYLQFLKAYCKMTYRAGFEAWWGRTRDNYIKLRRICRQLRDKRLRERRKESSS